MVLIWLDDCKVNNAEDYAEKYQSDQDDNSYQGWFVGFPQQTEFLAESWFRDARGFH